MNPFHIATLGILSKKPLRIATDGFIGIEIVIPFVFPSFAGGPVPPWPQDNKRAIVIRIRPSWSHFITTSVIDLNEKDWKFSIKIVKEQVAETTPRVSITLQEKDDVKVRVV